MKKLLMAGTYEHLDLERAERAESSPNLCTNSIYIKYFFNSICPILLLLFLLYLPLRNVFIVDRAIRQYVLTECTLTSTNLMKIDRANCSNSNSDCFISMLNVSFLYNHHRMKGLIITIDSNKDLLNKLNKKYSYEKIFDCYYQKKNKYSLSVKIDSYLPYAFGLNVIVSICVGVSLIIKISHAVVEFGTIIR